MRFENKVAIVTGGGTGIGAAVARRIVAEGGKVALIGRRPEPLRAVAEETGAAVFAADAADTASMKAAVSAIAEQFGGIDILIANAGGHGVGPTISMSDETWEQAIRLNLNTAFVSARETLPHLIRSKGNIVVLSSIAGLFAGPDAVGYVTMKHGCIGLAKSLARDYGRFGVRTNTVCPGWVATAMADEQMEVLVEKHKLGSIAEAYALVTRDVPLARPATAEEVANAVCFLACGEAAMINGAILTVDGGAGTVDLPTLAFVE
ncbi:short chain dehydrogenase/reductase family oxidoreductase [Brucella sp. 10RB9215]|uniref:SDR family oxidoreductase n=1 Tax=Brucella inopinata TaxID=1218315 RepID=A0AAW7B9M1_9HYPH|nr:MULTISPECIES: SDR family oxidoreductase [Brucella]KEY05029.1 3-oxoacyl-ACP reductase [Brucella suis bv. 4 str. 40]EFM56000.1 short chain dehydrogenase/reductase family oxidoreductase [Brucella inopinata BO1]EFM60030.1 short chain dehydrogenase/reductase family oxidoreductase [Brucella sp. BO2]MDL2334047.1 SDR family oxidoreductase [Brucella inopinata]QPN28581.1 SDR family oxidoreductase [Brucella sp. BO2]